MITLKMIIKGIRVLSRDIMNAYLRQYRFYNTIPVVATLFLTYRCNSRCKTCSAWRRDQMKEIKKEIDFDKWKIVIDKLSRAGVKNAEIFGGNVLLRKDLLMHVLQYLKEKDFTIHIPTNQIGLDNEIAEFIVRYADMVYISTDGIGGFQDEIRGQDGASDKVQHTITTLLKLRQDKKVPRLVCNTTVSKYNVSILEQVFDYALSMRFDEIHFEYVGEFSRADVEHSVVNGIKPDPNYIKGAESILLDEQGAILLKQTLRKIKKNQSAYDINITTVNIDVLSEKNIYNGTIPHDKCHVERTEITVDPSGNVVACPFITTYIMGNLVNNSLESIWNNDKHREFRRHQNKRQIAMCAHCILGVQRNPSFYTSLKRIYFNRIESKIRS